MKKSFVFLEISDFKFKDLFILKTDEKKDYFSIKSNGHKIYLKKRDCYPKTFIIKKQEFMILGYIDPILFSEFKKNLSSVQDINKFILEIKKYLDKEFLFIVLDKNLSEIRIYRDAICTVPIFYLQTHLQKHFQKNNYFVLSNQFSDLLPYLLRSKQINLDFQVLAEHILHLESLPIKTILPAIKILTERGILIKNLNELKVKYPKSWQAFPKTLSMKNPTQAFSEKLENNLNSYWFKFKNQNIGCEVSGGIDSMTCFGFYVKFFKKSIKGFSMLLPGKQGKSQKEKFKQIKKIFGLQMNMLPIYNLFPLKSQLETKKLKPFYPLREIYFDALNEFAKKIKQKGVKIIITGMGGDEAFKIDNREQVGFQGELEAEFRKNLKIPDFFTKQFKQEFLNICLDKNYFPIPAVPYSVLGANMARNNIYLNRNIWPVSPLANPEFINFCRRLPIKLRKNKKILRRYHKLKGYPEMIYKQGINENFAEFFESSIKSKTRNLFIQLFNNSILHDLRLVDKHKLIKQYLKYVEGKSNISPFDFYTIAVIEILLQSLNK